MRAELGLVPDDVDVGDRVARGFDRDRAGLIERTLKTKPLRARRNREFVVPVGCNRRGISGTTGITRAAFDPGKRAASGRDLHANDARNPHRARHRPGGFWEKADPVCCDGADDVAGFAQPAHARTRGGQRRLSSPIAPADASEPRRSGREAWSSRAHESRDRPAPRASTSA